MEKFKIYNIKYLKELIFQEVANLESKLKNFENLSYVMSHLEVFVEKFNKEDYSYLYNDFLYLDSFLPSYYNLSCNDPKYKKLNANVYYALKICTNYETNPERYNKSQYFSAKAYLKSIGYYLSDLYISKKVEMECINEPQTKFKMINYRKILTNLKYGNKIDSNQRKMINDLLDEKGFDPETYIFLLEVVRKHNVIFHLKQKKQRIDYNKLNEITSLFNLGYEKINVPYIGNNTNEYDAFIDTVIQVLRENKGIALDILPSYEGDLKFSSNYAKQEFTYIYNSILYYYQKNILDLIDMMKNVENYSDEYLRKIILVDYKKYMENYICVRNVYLKNLDKYEEDLANKEKEQDVIDVLYASTSVDQVSYLESDLKDIPKDRYKDLVNLLIRFKKDALAPSELKYLNEAFPGMGELRDDQLRILFKRDENNNFVIIGAFIKKEDNDRKNYVKFYYRGASIILPKEEAEKSLFEKIETSKHSGGRTNS